MDARRTFEQLKQVWLGMSYRRRVVLVLVSATTAILVLGIAFWASRPEYRVLFADLAPDDAAAVTAKLQARGIPFLLESGGTRIQVPAEHIAQARVELAGENLPGRGGKGFELFDDSPLGMTPFTQHVNYLRALQAELARTITQIDPVVQARVHIVQPDPSPFLRERKPTTASIVLRLRPGAVLQRNLARGIVALVSRSVEGLTRDNITLVDDKGHLLSEEIDPELGHVATQLDHRRELEAYLSRRAESMLAQVVGTGKAVVRVTADLNYQAKRTKKQTVLPQGSIRMESVTNENKGGAIPPARGTPGTSSNLGKDDPNAGRGRNDKVEQTTTEYELSRVIEEVEDKVGAVQRLTAAVLVDLTGNGKDGKALLSQEAVENMVKQAIGFQMGRDQITVTDVKLSGFEPLPEEDPAPAASFQRWQKVVDLVRNLCIGLACLTLAVVGWMAMRRLRPRPAPSAAPAGGAETVGGDDREKLFQQLLATAQQDPELLANILGRWLEPERETPRMAA